MGEVYRADDLKLGQPVALKFLPTEFEADADRLQRFLDEVRTARQISHTNVCRIYDAGEADGHHFLSMEYVDGEDLASLLRRIGHIPKDKAIQIARQLCAGLAASHEIGVLHRDLKPSNIMIDGKGRARITDFGLAAFAERIDGAEIRSGTPAYMAPEQLAGREVTVRSDLYALGLVLYELFTGKPAFRATSVEERRKECETEPSTPSSVMDGFDPAVERVIVRCLDPEPARRPSSALAVAASLPGGDPIAAALAAGETPSPEMVAEAGENVAVPPALSWGALAVFVLCVLTVTALSSRTSLIGLVPLEKPPEVLRERAREILKAAGHDAKAVDSLYAFDANRPYLDDVLQHGKAGPSRWDVLQSAPPAGVNFWYRESPTAIARVSAGSLGEWMDDPPETTPGMARVGLDPEGRLVSLLIVPGERAAETSASPEPEWDPLLRATGIDEKSLAPVPPEWAPPVWADRRAAWTGSWPGKPELPVRIEAAAARGRPVSLRIVEPWARPSETTVSTRRFLNQASQLLGGVIYVGVIVAAGFVALRNVRRGRGDRRGALRLALYLGTIRMLWFLGAHHVATAQETDLFAAHLAFSMLRVGVAYVFYLAIEPYARRLWPHMLVSWVRILDGRFRDPLVGRDILLGSACGALVALLQSLEWWLPPMLGGASAPPRWDSWAFEALRGTVPAFVAIVAIHTQQLFEVIFPITLLLVFRLLLRGDRWAVIAVSIVATGLFYPDSGSLVAYLVVTTLALFISWQLLFRAGLLAFAMSTTVSTLIGALPLTFGAAGWFAGATLLSLGFIAAPGVWGFWSSRAGRPLFRDQVLEPARGR